MKLTRIHFEFIADSIMPYVEYPTSIVEIADELAKTNPNFDRDKFIKRAVANWEDRSLASMPIDMDHPDAAYALHGKEL